MEFHSAANIFPLDEEHIDELAEDIRLHGQEEKIKIFDGKIVDGRRRYTACAKAGIEPKYETIQTDDPVRYVLSLNLHRRHLTPSQRSMIGARAREWYDQQAKERQQRKPKSVVANLPQQNSDDTGKARDAVGKVVGVSGKSIDHATKVLNNAEPEVIQAVDEGRMAVSTAAILSSEEPEKQREEATQPKRNRTYQSVSNQHADEEDDPEGEPEAKPEENGQIQVKGKGITLANEAINSLSRIPKNDALRKRGFQLVTDWIRRNK